MSAGRIRQGGVFVEIGADAKQFFAALNKVQREVAKVGAAMTNMGTRMMGFGAALAAPMALASRQFAAFDDAIRLTGAVSQATGAELKRLDDRARDLGATTSFTAVQVANLMAELGRAGFSPDQINVMTSAVLDLARATGTDATISAGIMAATMRQFGLNAEEATRAADVLTKTANATFNTVELLGESLKYAGPVAKSLGMSLEDTAAILGVLGNVGIRGSEAGTALRRLSVISSGAGEELQKLFGVSNQDAAGNLKPLIQILDEINTATASMPVAERTKRMADAFGLLGITSANVLSESGDGVRKLAEDLKNAGGTAATTAKQMDAGLGGSIRIMLSAIEGTALAIGDALAPALQRIAEIIINVAGGITEFVKRNEAMVVSIAKGVAVFIGAGAALLAMGVAVKVVAAAMAFLLSPLGSVAIIAAGAVVSLQDFSGAMSGLAAIAQTTFQGVYDAITAGDLAGAMDVLWAGLYAGWVRGTAAVMGEVDAWVAALQNTFTYLGVEIAVAWEHIYNGAAIVWRNISAEVLGIADTLVNGVMAMMDRMVAAVRKSWNYVQSFIKSGYDLAKENEKVDSEMEARRREREVARPGFAGRRAEAQRQNQEAERTRRERENAMRADADATAAGRYRENERRREERMAQSGQATGNLNQRGAAARALREEEQIAKALMDALGKATSEEELGNIGTSINALAERGIVSSSTMSKVMEAYGQAIERITGSGGGAGGASAVGSGGMNAAGVGEAASKAAKEQAEVAGTFSALAVGGMGFGSSLQQKANELLGKIEHNTRPSDDGLVGA